TGKPIEGAAIAAFWYRRTPAYAHDMVTAYTAQEAITDKDGRFRLEGLREINWIPFTRIQEAQFIIFAPGYAPCNRTGANAQQGCGLPAVELHRVSSLSVEQRALFSNRPFPGEDFDRWVPRLLDTLRNPNPESNHGASFRQGGSPPCSDCS
ncbi:MAG: hypothetical protein ACREQJ_03345, partial [Candidatus Binatia bacterium]